MEDGSWSASGNGATLFTADKIQIVPTRDGKWKVYRPDGTHFIADQVIAPKFGLSETLQGETIEQN